MEASPNNRRGHKVREHSERLFCGNELFFAVPHRVYTLGLVKAMGMAEFKRYNTLRWLANFMANSQFRVAKATLATLDGVSSRRAFDVNTKLSERGLIRVNTTTKPYTYVVLLPSEFLGTGVKMCLVKEGNLVKLQTLVEPPQWR